MGPRPWPLCMPSHRPPPLLGAGVRGKPGSGVGWGGGIRVDTPVGPLRLEYAWNRERVGRFHVGVGYE